MVVHWDRVHGHPSVHSPRAFAPVVACLAPFVDDRSSVTSSSDGVRLLTKMVDRCGGWLGSTSAWLDWRKCCGYCCESERD